MSELQQARASARDAPSAAADLLGSAAAPVVLADTAARGSQVLRELRRRQCGRRARSVTPAALAEAAAAIGNPAAALPAAGLFVPPGRMRAARAVRMQAAIHAYLAQANSSFAGLATAGTLARTLAEMEDYAIGDSDPFAGISADSAYGPELAFLTQLWMHQAADPQKQRRERLLAVADQAQAPAVQLSLRKPTPLQTAFMERWARRQAAGQVAIELDETAQELVELWSLPGCAQRPAAALTPMLLPADSIEDACRESVSLLADWLNRGHSSIGIVAYSRPLARRVNAECQARGIYPSDRIGWAADSVLVGDCILAASELALRNAPQAGDALAQALCAQLAGAKEGWAQPMRMWRTSKASAISEMLASLRKGDQARSPQAWLEEACRLAERPPLDSFLAHDLAAAQVIEHIRRLAGAFEGFAGKLKSFEMLGLLRESLARLHVATAEVRSPIHVVEPMHVPQEPFDALLLLGADASTLPHVPEYFAFNDRLRSELGLPTREDAIADLRSSTAALLAGHADRPCAAVWCGAHPSPYLELLAPDGPAAKPLRPPWLASDAGAEAQGRRSALLPAGEHPRRMTPSSADLLMSCPYRYFAGYLLKIDETDRLGLEDPSAHGSLVHAILEEFHAQFGKNSAGATAAALREVSERVLAEQLPDPAERERFSWRWRPLQEKYIRAMQARELAGWQFVQAEDALEAELDPALGIALEGRIDLRERHADGSTAVADIKTGAATAKDSLSGEKPQLLLYAHMADAKASASYLRIVRIDAGVAKVDDQRLKDASDDLPKRMLARLRAQAQAMFAQGAPLPANGAAKSCRTCTAAGLCRRPHWSRSDPEQ